MTGGKDVSVIIPTLNAEGDIDRLLDCLDRQSHPPKEIIIIDSSSDDRTVERARTHSLVRVIEIKRNDFDHGGTRNMGLNEAAGEFVLFMTQDAIPADAFVIENLLHYFDWADVAIASARQIPKDDARPFERLVREFNYGHVSNKRTEEDIARLGIKAFFSSDVCCMYRRSSVESIGGIPAPCSTNEDMLAAARCLRAGMCVCYAADACVFHSHNLSFAQQFSRNKAVGAFLATHADELNVPSEFGEGRRLVRHVVGSLLEKGQFAEIFWFGLDCVARLAGNRLGRRSVS